MYGDRLWLYPGETWADAWGAMIGSPVEFAIAVIYMLAAISCTVLVYRWRIIENAPAMVAIVFLSFAEWMITASTFTHLGFIHAWELHFVDEGMALAYLVFAVANIQLIRAFRWKNFSN